MTVTRRALQQSSLPMWQDTALALAADLRLIAFHGKPFSRSVLGTGCRQIGG